MWVHQPASNLQISLDYPFPMKATYCAYNNGFFAWHGCEWRVYGQAYVPLTLSCGFALPS